MAKGKKGKKNANEKVEERGQETEASKEAKSKETNEIIEAITNMDLDNADFIDLKAFDQSKAILVNALDDLEAHLRYFEKGEYDRFPKAQAAEWSMHTYLQYK